MSSDLKIEILKAMEFRNQCTFDHFKNGYQLEVKEDCIILRKTFVEYVTREPVTIKKIKNMLQKSNG